MENPWASPWATTDSDDHVRSEAAAVANPEPPPPAFFSATPNNLTIHSSNSAWTEDESFGDWSAPEPTPSTTPSGWGIWGSGDGAAAEGQLTPKHDRRRKGSNPQWPNSRSTSPGLRPPPLSKRSSSDHLALDPWASEPSFNRRDDPEPHIQPLPSLPTADRDGLLPPVLRGRASNISITIEPQSPPPLPQQNGPDNTLSTDADSKAPSLQHGSTTSPATSISDTEGIQGTANHDSPITPVDETPMNQDADRKASKVQELVTMFDGIARKSSFTPELVPGPRRDASQESSTRYGTPVQVTPPPAVPNDDNQLRISKKRMTSLVRGTTVATESDEDGDTPVSVIDPPALPVQAPDEPPETEKSLQEDNHAGLEDPPALVQHEPFNVDLGKLDELFTSPKSNVTGDDITVPDHIINDSFESISERKAWYRISRFGPMRQHNMGNDEAYVRINWATSTVRPETITTVRRWMEEDSMGSRPYRGTLGKGAGGPAFGWNQPSTPVSLDEFFRRAKPERATPEPNPRSSLPPPVGSHAGEHRPVSLPAAPPSEGNAWGGLATFGWASEPPAQKASPVPAPTQDAAVPSQARPIKLQAPPKKMEISAPPPVSVVKDDQSDDDEDEWGEMVTPSVQDFPTKPAAFSWESPASSQTSGSRSKPTPKDVAITRTSEDEPAPSDLSKHAPLTPTENIGNETLPRDVRKVTFQDESRVTKRKEHNALAEAVAPHSKAPWNGANSSGERPPSVLPDDAEADEEVARQLVSKFPDLRYMLR